MGGCKDGSTWPHTVACALRSDESGTQNGSREKQGSEGLINGMGVISREVSKEGSKIRRQPVALEGVEGVCSMGKSLTIRLQF